MTESQDDSFDASEAEVFEALGHPTRIRLLQTLSENPLPFSGLKRAAGLESNGLLTFHLGRLRRLVRLSPEGAYTLTDEGREALRMIEASRTPHSEPGPSRPAFRVLQHKAVVVGLALILVALVVIGALFGYAYVTNANTISSLQSQTSQDQSTIQSLENQVSSLKSQVQAECGSIITASITLSKNVGPCSYGNGLVIGAGNIVLNCAGHAISGIGSELTGAGIHLAGISNVTVENCDVIGFQSGFLLNSSSYNTLNTDTANNDTYGFVLVSSSSNILTKNMANNDEDSFDLGYSSNNNTLTTNTADNDDFGFALYQSDNNTLTTNTADNDGHYGIGLDLSSYNNLTTNTANNNAANGFFLKGYSSDNTLSGNTANSNTVYGYYDLSIGSGTEGTANFYAGDICSGNGAGCSSPSGLGTPQS